MKARQNQACNQPLEGWTKGDAVKFNLKETEKAYIAGFFDGEGHISITKQKPKPPRWKNPTYQLKAIITNTNEAIIDGVNDSFSGVAYKHGPYASSKPDGKPMFQLHFCGLKCQAFLAEIKDYLIVKKNQAELALQYVFLANRTCPNKGLTDFDLVCREEQFQLMRELNHKGVHNH